jgi:hypothetical protein
MSNPKMTRRSVAAMAAALSVAAPVGAQDVPPPVRDLQLPPELRAEIDQRARRAIEEARWLEELPLDGVDPGFVFSPE